jgi:hypothetical protein
MTSDLYRQQEDCNAHEDTLVPWSISVLVGGSSKHKKRVKIANHKNGSLSYLATSTAIFIRRFQVNADPCVGPACSSIA